MKELIEALEVITNINEDLSDELRDKGIYLSCDTDGYGVIIQFMNGYTLWSSEDDCRECDEETDEYEPLEDYVKRELKTILTLMLDVL